jgi:hypothetical protein
MSAKNIRNKQVSFKVHDESNCITQSLEKEKYNYENRPIDPESKEIDFSLPPENFQFTDFPEMRFSDSKERPVLFGLDALNLSRDEEYILRFPIKYGAFNVSPDYPIQ